MVVLGKPRGFVEYQRDTEITTKEEQQGKQQGEDEEPQGEILEHAKDECWKQHDDHDQALRTGTARLDHTHSSDYQPATWEGRYWEQWNPSKQHQHAARMNEWMCPKQTNEGIVWNEFRSDEAQKERSLFELFSTNISYLKVLNKIYKTCFVTMDTLHLRLIGS